MRWTANWIWSPGEPSPRNAYVMFRKTFKAKAGRTLVHLSADTRYILHVNGVRIGYGPVRSHPWKQRYDTHDVTDFLMSGENDLAILVQHEGTSNFQYIARQGGLLVQVEQGGKTIAVSDKTWRTRRSPAWADNTPQISCQQGHTEHFDARAAELDWTYPFFDDSHWDKSVIVCKAASETNHKLPWSGLTAREIPQLTEEEVFPIRVFPPIAVTTPQVIWNFDPRHYVDPTDRSSNPIPYRGILYAIVPSPKKIKAAVLCQGVSQGPRGIWINGVEMADNGSGRVEVELKKGDNLFTYKFSGNEHQSKALIVLELDAPRDTRLKAKNGWTYIATDPEQIKTISTPADIERLVGERRPLLPRDAEQLNVARLFLDAKTVELKSKHAGRVENLQALATPGPEIATFHPPAAGVGVDLQFKLDFGKELTGFWEFEVDAPEGTIIDLNAYEGLYADGSAQYPPELDNSVRYVCTAGRQSFRSFFRHGFRYLQIAIRHASGPVKFHKVSTWFSSYPHPRRGEFRCSDPLLDKIWEMGALTLRNCSEDTFVDCPMFEQTFWVGDARNESLVHNSVVGDPRLPERCWIIAAESLDSPTNKLKLTNCQCPSGWELVLTAWTLFWMIGCEEHYRITGSKKFVKTIYPAVRRCAEELLTSVNTLGLIEYDAWNLLDWAPMDYQPISIHNSAWTVKALEATAKLAVLDGEKVDARRYLDQAQSIKTAINKHAWSEEKNAYIDSIHPDGKPSTVASQQTNTAILLCDCTTPQRLTRVRDIVLIPPKDFVKSGSPFMDFFIAEAFEKQGDYSAILDLFRKNWGLMNRFGATTCWETYPKINDDGTVAQYLTRSHCHAWSAAPTYFLSLCQLGIRAIEPGYTKIQIAPQPAGLSWAEGSAPVLDKGDVHVKWSLESGRFVLEATVPAGIPVQIVLPGEIKKFKAATLKSSDGFEWSGAGPFEVPASSGAEQVIRVTATA